jgi:type I restriction enzyme S subunit
MDKITPHCRDISSYSEEAYSGGAKFVNGCTLMARITPCLENGKISQVRFLDEYEVAFGSTEFIVFEEIEGVSDKDFIYYLVNTELVRQKAIDSMVGSSGRQRAQSDEVAKILISLPPLPTQRKIAAVLGALDDKIENNRKICANLEAQAQALFKSWFVDFEPFGGKMPKDWREFKLSDIAEFYGGYSYKGSELQESSCAMATIKNYERGGGFKLDGFKEIVPSEKLKTSHEVDLFDTIVAHTDLTQKAEVIGNAEMLLSKAGYEKIIMSMDLVKVLPKSGISKFLLGALLKNPIFKSHCLRYVNGTTVLHLSKMALQEYALYLPSKIDDLKNVEKLFEGVARKQAFAVNESRALAELRDALLPKLMSGELDVDDVEV